MTLKINKIRGHNLYVLSFDDNFKLISSLIRFVAFPDEDPDGQYSYTNQDCYEGINESFNTSSIFEVYNAFYFNLSAMFSSYTNNMTEACSLEEEIMSKLLMKRYDSETSAIAYVKGDIPRLEHEVAHYLFDKNIKYREGVFRIFDQHATEYDMEALESFLVGARYTPYDMDEMQAHIATEKGMQKDYDLNKKLCRSLKANFKKYSSPILERIKT